MNKQESTSVRNQDKFDWVEDWILDKLIIRLWLYRKKYPMFDIHRFVEELTKWPIDAKTQRWWPYMTDKDIKKKNVSRRKGASIASMVKGQS